ncbi:MAG: biotin-dependent carboxyltransferase family protein [Vicinamibacterales bacterium]
MSDMLDMLEVLAPGLFTTVQDLGRWGHQSSGVPVAGAMDPFAHRLANAIVSNPRDAATLEITLTGPTLAFHVARSFAVSGASFDLFVDDRPVETEGLLEARAGSVLRFGARRAGARAYLAVAGGIDVPLVLGSRATHVPSAMGGCHGRALRKGDRLPLGAARPAATTSYGLPRPLERQTQDVAIVRVMSGPQADRFTPDALDALTASPYQVDSSSNRMGYRLVGPTLGHRHGADIISDATPLGTVQVPASGQPLLLMADRQTTGGYAKIATVISADIGVAGQVAPGGFLHFQACSRADAIAALLVRERRLLALESRGA